MTSSPLDQEFLCIWCKYTFNIIIIHVYCLNVRPHAQESLSQDKINFAYAYLLKEYGPFDIP
jgi:hypothetical protein